MSTSTNWHSMEIEEITDRLEVNLPEGLSVSEAASRLEQYGENEIRSVDSPPSFFWIFVSQFLSFSSIILAAIAITLLFVDFKQAVFVIGILMVNVLFGYIQQSRSETRIRTIFEPDSFHTKLIRDGRILEVESELVVPGDLVAFESGDYIPADARLVEANSLTVDESAITEELDLSEKAVFVLQNEDAPISERANMVYGGSYVIEGSGIGLVVATGANLELNKISSQTTNNLKQRLETSVQTQLSYLSRYLEIRGIVLAILMIGIAYFLGMKTVYEIFTVGFCTVLASTPVGLLNLSDYSLISTAFDIFKKGAKLKHLSDIETLAKIDTLCTGIRGYFTDEDMTVKQIFINGQLLEDELLENYLSKIRRLGEQSHVEESGDISYNLLTNLHLLLIISGLIAKNKPDKLIDTLNNQVVNAIEDSVEQSGLNPDDYNQNFQMVEGASYSPERRQRTLIMKNTQTNSHMILTLGHTQAVIENCSKIQLNGSTEPLEEGTVNDLLRLDQYLQANSASVFSVAYRKIPTRPGLIRNEQHSMIFLGMLTFEKHIRDNAQRGIEMCKNAGIRNLTITDENLKDALNDASLIGIADDKSLVIDCQKASQTDFWNNERYIEVMNRAKVFCKPTLENRYKILSRLKNSDRHIAMAIDEPEDLELIKNNVDLSIAMSSLASDVAVNSADLLVYEGGFKTIIDAIMLAKEAYYTLRNSIRWILSSVVGQLLTYILGSIIYFISPQNFTMPFSLSQIVWINFLVNILPLFVLGKSSTGEMFYTKYSRVEELVLSDYRWDIILRGIVVALISLISFVFTAKFSVIEHVQTATCTTLIFAQLMTGLQCYKYSTRINLRKRISMHRSLWITVFSCIVLHLLIIYIPFIQSAINFSPLDIEWFWILPFWFVSMLPVDLTKERR